MSTPVELSDLPPLSNTTPNDLMLIRQGLTDYKASLSLIQDVNIESLNPLPNGSGDATDKFMISRIVSGVRHNFQITFSQVSVPKGTKMWFYCSNSGLPPNWSIVPNTGDKLLAVSDNVNQYDSVFGGSSGGAWQQNDHALTLSQLPAHAHDYLLYQSSTSDDRSGLGALRGKLPTNTNRAQTDLAGQNQGHNHGDLWRPLANVGCIGNKDT